MAFKAVKEFRASVLDEEIEDVHDENGFTQYLDSSGNRRLAVSTKEEEEVENSSETEDGLKREILKRALSIRQPLSEQILRGKKKKEFRSRVTHIRGRVYLYAGKKVAAVKGFTDEEARALPRSVIVGSVEIVGCHWDKKNDCFAWELANPRRYRKPLITKGGVPQPGFWHPKF